MRYIAVLFSVLLLAGLSFSLTSINSCAILNQSGETYQLTADVSGAPYNVDAAYQTDLSCIVINSSNIVFDCNGYSITRPSAPSGNIDYAGILVNPDPSTTTFSNIVIRNCPNIQNYTFHMLARNMTNSQIYNNTVYGAYPNWGIRCDRGCSNLVIRNNTVSGGYGGILVLFEGTNNQIYNNRVIDNDVVGIEIDSSYTNVTDNTVSGAGTFFSFYANDNAAYSRFEYNNASDVGIGFYMQSDHVTVRNNRAWNCAELSGAGFSIGGTNTLATQNIAYNNAVGFEVSGAGNNASNNNVYSNTGDGFTISNAYASLNNVYSNGGNGFSVGSDAVVERNSIYSNGNDGISIVADYDSRINRNTIYSNGGDGISLDSYYACGEGCWGAPAQGHNITNNSIYGNSGYGISIADSYNQGTSNNRLISNNVTLNGLGGVMISDSDNIVIDPSYYCNNTGDGLSISNAVGITINDSVFCNNTGSGLYLSNVNSSTLKNNSAYGNSGDGFELSQGTGNSVTNNSANYNGQSGFSVGSMAYSSFANNSARYNQQSGFALGYDDRLTMTNNTAWNNNGEGFGLTGSTNFVMNNNSAWYNGLSGYLLFNEANNNNLTDNSAFQNQENGIEVYSSSNNRLVHNTVNQNNRSGIIVYEYKSTVPTNNNTLVNNLPYINDYGITLGAGSTNTTSSGDAPYNNRIAEMRIIDTQNATILNGDYSGNAYDVVVEGQSGGSYRMQYAMFGEPGGSVVNMTNLSITDTFGSSDNYTLNWTQRTDSPTYKWHSFRNRTVSINDRSATNSTIDYIEWDWTAGEAAGYNETNLGLWKYNSSGWTLMNNSPNTGAHHLSLTNLRPRSDYALYEYIENCPLVNTSGTFTMIRNYNGSTNPVYLPIGGSPQYACVVINVSNVVFDCNGYNITGNLSSGATAGIAVESGGFYSPRLSNITIKNCPLIRNYSVGVILYNASDSLVTNVTVKNNSLTSSVGFMLYYSPKVNLTNTLAENHSVYNYYINLGSDNVRVTNSTARTSGSWGFYFSNSIQNATITDSVAYNNNGSGIVMDSGGFPVVARNNVSNGAAYTADAGIIIDSSNALVEDNNASGAVSTPVPSWGYGFIIGGNNVTFRRNLAYGNKIGIEAYGSGCNITNNTARNNLVDGFAIYSEDDIYANNYAFSNGNMGFAMNYTYTGTFSGNRAFNNTQGGFYMDEDSQENAFTGNWAYNNTNGFLLNAAQNNTFTSNNASLNSYSGFSTSPSSPYNRFTNNLANGNGQMGFAVASGNGQFTGNNASGNDQYGVQFGGGSAFANVFETGNANSNGNAGIYLGGCHDNIVRTSVANGNTQDGFNVGGAPNNTLQDNSASNNLRYGFYVGGSTNTTLNRNTASGNTQAGVYLVGSTQNGITSNTANGNGQGFQLDSSSNNVLTGNNATNNGQNGFFVSLGSNNVLSNNRAYGNPSQGFYVSGGSSNNLTGNIANASNSCFRAQNSPGNVFANDVAENCSYRGFFFQSSSGTAVSDSQARNNVHSGFETDATANSAFSRLTANNNQYGFVMWTGSSNDNVSDSAFFNNSGVSLSSGIYVYGSSNVRLSNVSLYQNGPQGLLVEGSNAVSLLRSPVFSNAQFGAMVNNSNTAFDTVHFYNNGADFEVSGTGITVSFNNVVFDNPAGNYANYTNLSMNDTVASSYSMDWADNSTVLPLPANKFSFAQKFVNITQLSGTVSIDTIVWHWLDSELVVPYNEEQFQLWLNDGSWANSGFWPEPTDNSITAGNLSSFGIYAILQNVPVNGEEPMLPTTEAYSVRMIPSCEGFIVDVKDAGEPVADAMVVVKDSATESEIATLYTNSSGKAFVSQCDLEVSIKASKDGREGTDSGMADCGICPECATDDDCADTEQCADFQCVPINCPGGRVTNHACELYECTSDSDCPAGQICKDHRCVLPYECRSDADCGDKQYCDIKVGEAGGSCLNVTLQPCGEVKNHQFVPYGYECGTEPGCPSCGQGFYCADHKCIQNDVSCPSTGIVGDRKTCEAKEDNKPCANCDYVVTDPAGKNMTGKTDENGNFILPLNLKGTYKVALLKDGVPVRIVEVKALPVSQAGEEGGPSAAGGMDAGTMALFLIILLAFGIAVILYSRRGKGEKKQAPKK